MAYLRMAGRGNPTRGPVIFQRLADAAKATGDLEAAAGYLGQIKRSGIIHGPDKLNPEAKAIYLAALKELVEQSEARKDFSSAVEDMRLMVEAGKEDVPTLRKLAELYAAAGDPLNALLITERGLLYAKTDADLLAKRDSYYYSVPVERLELVKDKIGRWFDVGYLLRKAKQVADQRESDLDTLDYGLHLVKLARVMEPKSHAAMLAQARLELRKANRDGGLSLLEDIREQPRGSGEEEEAWYFAVRLLGDIYLDEIQRPDLAISCYNAFRESDKSGADTLYQLGRAYEAAGNAGAALKAYEMVTMYPKHPRYDAANDAVRRLKG
jgi:tetratricopeptide (TPR) repeat protein